jgi:hypothetical protein
MHAKTNDFHGGILVGGRFHGNGNWWGAGSLDTETCTGACRENGASSDSEGSANWRREARSKHGGEEDRRAPARSQNSEGQSQLFDRNEYWKKLA